MDSLAALVPPATLAKTKHVLGSKQSAPLNQLFNALRMRTKIARQPYRYNMASEHEGAAGNTVGKENEGLPEVPKKEADPVLADINKRIEEAFDIFDHEHNKTVDVREVGTIIRSLGCYPSETDLHDMIQVVSEGLPSDIHLH